MAEEKQNNKRKESSEFQYEAQFYTEEEPWELLEQAKKQMHSLSKDVLGRDFALNKIFAKRRVDIGGIKDRNTLPKKS
ncbi:hypothetical protein Tco_1247006 [Tanacetum coccineum]